MYTPLIAAIGIGSLVTLGLPRRPPAHPAASPAVDTTLASKLAGTWQGTRFDSSGSAGHKFTMSWKQDSAGTLNGTVTMPGAPSYATRVVWSSDTAFITESAPHQSPELHEQVVTRSIGHLQGDSISGTFELRPTAYRGRTDHGRFAAKRES